MKIRLPIRKPAALAKRPTPRPPTLKLKASVASRRRATPLIEEEEDEFLDEPEPNMKLSHAFVVVLVLHVIAVAGVFAFNSIKAKQSADVFAAAKPDATASAAAPEPASAANPVAAAPAPAAAPSVAPATLSAPPAATPAAAARPITAPPGGRTHLMQPGETLTKVAAQHGVTVAAIQELNKITDPTKIAAGTVLALPAGAAATAAPVAKAPPAAITAATPAPAKPAAAPVAKDSGKVYVVEKGDNPVKIAKKLNVSYAALMEANGNPDPRKLQIGQKLKVPSK